MNRIKISIICFLAAALGIAGCAKVPDKLISPMVRIEPAIKENKEVFSLKLSTGLQNENSDVVFLNMKGNIVFHDSSGSKAAIVTLPFILPAVLPFDTGIIELEKIFSDNEIAPLLMLLGSDKEKLINEKGIERTMDDKNIGLELAGYEKKDILDVLKGKMNEKD